MHQGTKFELNPSNVRHATDQVFDKSHVAAPSAWWPLGRHSNVLQQEEETQTETQTEAHTDTHADTEKRHSYEYDVEWNSHTEHVMIAFSAQFLNLGCNVYIWCACCVIRMRYSLCSARKHLDLYGSAEVSLQSDTCFELVTSSRLAQPCFMWLGHELFRSPQDWNSIELFRFTAGPEVVEPAAAATCHTYLSVPAKIYRATSQNI